jgi:hypothetical protein
MNGFSDTSKIKISYRVACFFICIFSIIGLLGALAFGTQDGFWRGLLMAAVPLLLLTVCSPIALSGYPPKFLMWILDRSR